MTVRIISKGVVDLPSNEVLLNKFFCSLYLSPSLLNLKKKLTLSNKMM